MVQDNICFDVQRDVKNVEQFGFVDLQAANVTSSIPVIDGLDDQRFNGIEDPRSIGSMPKDVFEQMQANKVIVGYKAPVDESKSE